MKTTETKCPRLSRSPAYGCSASWSKAEIHFEMAKAAWRLAARNEHGAAMVIEHMERAIKTLKAMTPSTETT